MKNEDNRTTYKHSKQSIMRGFVLYVFDFIFIAAIFLISLLLRFDFSFTKLNAEGPEFWGNLIKFMPFGVITVLIIFQLSKLYSSLWRFAGAEEAVHICAAALISTIICQAELLAFHLHLPRSFMFFAFPMILLEAAGTRFGYRIARQYRRRYFETADTQINTMIIGAGKTGVALLNEMCGNGASPYKPVCIVDNDPYKVGLSIHGVKVEGEHEGLDKLIRDYEVEEVIIALPNATAKRRKEIIDICNQTKCKIKTVPSLEQLINEEVSMSGLKDIDLEDLLGREVNLAGNEKVIGYIKNQVVVVTGGGGSIGSELCRQIASYQPKQLIIIDNYENNAYAIQMELVRKYPNLDLKVLICTVQNRKRIHNIFNLYKPDVVFHAAAHKHVPLMEDSPCDAVRNNCCGTYNVASEAGMAGVKRMVLISTDKAVRPTNVMGATKRICEKIIQYNNAVYPDTEYMAVRFGNVLGSNGSVVPLFRKQIAEGGPVTVTHPDIIRYFMTIPEAVSLVLEAGSYKAGGNIFLLDMGEPVKILDMAENLIRLSGYEPYKDIDIQFTGLRPGEKLYEELLIDEDNLLETENDRIFIAQLPVHEMESFKKHFHVLGQVAHDEDVENIRGVIKRLVPEYRDPEEVNGEAGNLETAVEAQQNQESKEETQEVNKAVEPAMAV